MTRKIIITMVALLAAVIIILFFSDRIQFVFVKTFGLSREIKTFDKKKRMHGKYLRIDKGITILEGNYRHGSAEGIFKTYYPNGKIKEKTFYKNNKMFGANLGYYKNGNPNYKIYYSNGLLYGDSFHYDEKGELDVYGANDIEHSFFYYSNYSGSTPKNVIGTIFSENIYSYDLQAKETVILSDKAEFRNISDLYITFANPPQLSREVEIEINKGKWTLNNLKSSTVLIPKIFHTKGGYNISIKARLKDIKGVVFKTDSLNMSILKI